MHTCLRRELPKLELYFTLHHQTIHGLKGNKVGFLFLNDPENSSQIGLLIYSLTMTDIETHDFDLNRAPWLRGNKKDGSRYKYS